jgi:hypothetical protein
VATPNLCLHAHTYTSSHTHTTHISKRKRDRGTHTTLAKWGSVSRKIKKEILNLEGFSAGVDNAQEGLRPEQNSVKMKGGVRFYRRSYCSSRANVHVRATVPATWRFAWKFARAHSFLTRFSKAILEAFWYSKWVMHHIVGKPQMSTFQEK